MRLLRLFRWGSTSRPGRGEGDGEIGEGKEKKRKGKERKGKQRKGKQRKGKKGGKESLTLLLSFKEDPSSSSFFFLSLTVPLKERYFLSEVFFLSEVIFGVPGDSPILGRLLFLGPG